MFSRGKKSVTSSGNSFFAADLICSKVNIWYIDTNMKAELLYHIKEYLADGPILEIKIWKIVRSKDKPHGIKYSLAFIVDGERIIGYDNAESKGDHKHYLDQESSYTFEGIDKLWDDFMGDIERFKRGKL